MDEFDVGLDRRVERFLRFVTDDLNAMSTPNRIRLKTFDLASDTLDDLRDGVSRHLNRTIVEGSEVTMEDDLNPQ
jgi:hypothetical protein